MARTIEEYKAYIEEHFVFLILEGGWKNMVDNMIDYDGIEFPIEENTEPIEYDLKEKRAWRLQGDEERKAAIAFREYLQEKIDAYAGRETYMRMEGE